jgi:hypothetical protein
VTDVPHTPQPDEPEDAEVVEGEPVADAAPSPLPDTLRAAADVVLASPARQVATICASGFVAGAATVALVHRRKSKTAVKALKRRNGRPALGEIVSSSSFLVDVHLLRRD